MKIEKTMKYLKSKLKDAKNILREYRESKNKYEIEKKELFAQIESYKKQIDEAYDIFSPKSTRNTFYKEQVAEFEKKLDIINTCIEEIEEKCNIYKNEKKELEDSISELNSYINEKEQSMNQEENISKNISKNINKEIDCINIDKSDKSICYDEKNKFSCEMIKVSRKQIRDIIYKCENCKAFINMDMNRSKLEMEAIISLLKKYMEQSDEN